MKTTADEVISIIQIHVPEAKSQESLRGGLEGVLACISNEDGSRQQSEWFPLIDGRDTIHSKAKMFARKWAEGDQPE